MPPTIQKFLHNTYGVTTRRSPITGLDSPPSR